MLSNVISLILRDSDTDSENASLIQLSVSDGQKTLSSKDVSELQKRGPRFGQ